MNRYPHTTVSFWSYKPAANSTFIAIVDAEHRRRASTTTAGAAGQPDSR